MRSLWAAGFLLRRLRAEVGVVALLLALVAVTSFLFAGAPRLFNLVADGALVHEIRAADVVHRDVQISDEAAGPPGDGTLAAVDAVGGAYLDLFPDSLKALIAERRYTITTPRFAISKPPRYTTFVALRYQDGLQGAIEVVAGRMPTASGDQVPSALGQFGELQPEPPGSAARVEIAVSQATANEIGIHVGDALAGVLDNLDPMLRGVRRGERVLPLAVQFEVVGIFSVVDPAADVWYADTSLQHPQIGGSDEFPIAYATALVAPEAYPDLTTSGLPFGFAWRYFVAPERVDVGQLPVLTADLQRLESHDANTTFGGQIDGDLVLRTGLLGVIGGYLSERAVSEAVLSVATIGPFALAAGAIAMVAILLVMRRRANLELARSRGASGFLLLGAQLWEATLLTGAAALIGLLVAVRLVPGRESSLSLVMAFAASGAAAAALVAATWPAARRRLGQRGRDDPGVLPTSPRRLVLELTGVGLAVAGVLLLRQRGLVIGNRQAGEIVRLDPFLAAVPVLAGLAMGIVAMRLYPLPIRAFGWLAARRRDLVPVLGLRNVGRHSGAANLPLLVLMLTAAFGAFASVVTASIDRGQVEAAWSEVGADYRIDVGRSAGSTRFDPTSIHGVRAAAAAYVDPSADFADTPTQRSQVVLQAVDTDAYLKVAAGSPIAISWPFSFTARVAGSGQPGTPDAPIPAIVSIRSPSGSGPLTPGDTFVTQVGVRQVTFVVVDRRASFPGVRADSAFVIAPLATLDLAMQAYGDPPLSPSVLFVSGSSDIGAQLTARAVDFSPTSAVTSRFAAYDTLRQAPFVAMITDGFRIALLVAVLYAALAIVAALTLTASRRSQDLAFLRTLGLSARQGVGLTVIEHGPPVVLALVPGVALGIWIAALLGPGLGIAAFVGTGVTLAVEIAWGEIALVATALIMMVIIAGVTSTWLVRRGRAVDALRSDD